MRLYRDAFPQRDVHLCGVRDAVKILDVGIAGDSSVGRLFDTLRNVPLPAIPGRRRQGIAYAPTLATYASEKAAGSRIWPKDCATH